MKTILAALSLAAFVLVAAAPAPDALLDKVIAGARAVPIASVNFERTVRRTTTDKGSAPQTQVQVDRWDGKQLTVVSIDGKPPTAEQSAGIKKAQAGKPVAGYYRLADFLKGARRVGDAQGRTVYRVDGLPKGSMDIGRDISADLVAEAVVETVGEQPYVSRLHIYLPKPLSFFMIAKLDSFDVVSDYHIGADGRPALLHQVQAFAGSQMGSSGQTRAESTYKPLR